MIKPRILLTRRWPEAVETALRERYDASLNTADKPLAGDEIKAAFKAYDAVCPTVSDRITLDMLEDARAKIIGNYGVGFSHIDIDACRRFGITVTNTPDVLTDATADLAMTLILMTARRAGEGERHVRGRAWTGWRPTHMMGTQVTGKTLGLVGFGRIAQAVARKARGGFSMKILYYSRRAADRETERALGAKRCETLDELLTSSDFVSIHTPGGAATKRLISAERIAQMKPTAFLINTARGEIIDEVALIHALRTKQIAGAGLDVYEREPSVPEAFLSLDNAVLLPHLGSATTETRVAMGMRVKENLDAFFSGKAPRDRIV